MDLFNLIQLQSKLVPIRSQAAAVLTFVTLIGCASQTDDSVVDVIGKNLGERETIVRQTDKETAIISKHDRQYWVDLRKDTRDERAKLGMTLATGDWQATESDARSVLMQYPGDVRTLSILAVALTMQKKYALADYYTKLAARSSEQESAENLNLRALARLSVPKLRMADIRTAIEMLEQAFESSQREIASGLNLGNLLLETGDSASALGIFVELQKRCNKCIAAQVGLGIAHGRLRQYDEARSAFEEVLSQQKHHPQALYRLAMISYQDEKDKEKAKRYIDTLMTYTPSDAVLIRQRAEALVRAMDAEKEAKP
jgi:tetratricopeptide (TPR) repeat protein